MLEETLLSNPSPAISSFLTFKYLRVTDVSFFLTLRVYNNVIVVVIVLSLWRGS